MSANHNSTHADLPKPDGALVYLADLARERGWSKRKLEHVVAQKRIVFWQELTPGGKGRRYTTRAEIEAFDRRNGTPHVSAASLAVSNEGRIGRLETEIGRLNREIREIREKFLTTDFTDGTDRRAA